MRKWIFILSMALSIPFTSADIIYLKSGGKLSGKVTIKGEKIEIVLPYGTLTMARSQVKKIERAIDKVDQYRQMESVIEAEDAEGHYQLAIWCKENKLRNRYVEQLKKTIAIAPNHKKARQALGHVYYKGRWMPYEQSMKLKGYVKFRGQWVTPSERENILLQELKAELEKEKRLRKQAEERLEQAEQRISQLEIKFARLTNYVEEVAEEAKRRRYVIYRPYSHKNNYKPNK